MQFHLHKEDFKISTGFRLKPLTDNPACPTRLQKRMDAEAENHKTEKETLKEDVKQLPQTSLSRSVQCQTH